MPVPSPKRRSRRFRDRWLDVCDRVACRLVDAEELPPELHGFRLLIAALLLRGRTILIPSQLSQAWRRRTSDQSMSGKESRGIARIIDRLEYLAGRCMDHVRFVGLSCYRLFVPQKLIRSAQSAERAVMESSTDTLRDVGSWFHGLGRMLVPGWLRRWLHRYASPAATCYNFGIAWTKSRSWKKLFLGMPVVVFALPLLGAVSASLVYSNARKQSHYQRALELAVESRDATAEAMYLEKLAQLGFRRMDRAEFVAALELSRDDTKWNEAVARMQALAPVDSPGFGEAHLWLAGQLMQGKLDVPDRWERIEKHARHALDMASQRNRYQRDRARLVLARVMEHRGQWYAASQEMKELSDGFPTLHFDLMERALANNRGQEAKSHARRVIAICESLAAETEASPDEGSLPAPHFRSWTLATQLLDGEEAAEAVVRRGIARFPGDSFLTWWLGNHIARELVNADLTSDTSLDCFREIFRHDPKNAIAISRLKDLALADLQHAQSITQSLSLTESLPAGACLAMGDQRWSQGDAQGARWFYEYATQIDPMNVAAWNNVAWLCGCVEDTLDLDRALHAVNKAIAIEEDPRCYETRGQIYARLEKWPEAIRDLERAVNGALPDSRPAHETLARVLEAIGDAEAAAAHRRKAKQTE